MYWCESCSIIKPTKLGCLNIPFSNKNGENIFTIKEIVINGDKVDFSNPDIEDAFMIIKKIDDNKANIFETLSLVDGDMVVGLDGHELSISFSQKLLDYSQCLYYQFFLKESGKNYPLFKGELINQNFF